MAAPSASASPSPVVIPFGLTAILTGVKERWSGLSSSQRPWSELIDRSALSKPESLGEAATRIRKNAAYFRVNYLIVMGATCITTFLMNPSSLMVLGILLGVWIYFMVVRQAPVVISGRTLSDREKLMGLSAISFITVFFLTSVGSVLFYALALSTAIVALHGAYREPDNLFLDEQPDQSSSLFGLFGPSSTAPQASSVSNV